MNEANEKTVVDESVGESAGDSVAARDDSTGVSRGPTVLASRYELLGLLGSGGMGTVYRARDRELDELVALKVLRKELAQAPGMLERFRREVKLARKVTHVNVARTFDIGEDGGDRFLTMELVDGEPVSALAARSRIALGRVLAIGREILEGLAASHDAGVVHGDLKPENVICAKNGRVVITDFGIARALSVEPGAERTATGIIVGTPQYMAPEQVEGTGDLDGRSDIYALGCMLFRLVTGEPAWSGTSYVTIAAARLLHDPPDPAERLPGLPERVRAFVLRCMARDRNDRYPDARAAAAALTVVMAHATAHVNVTKVGASGATAVDAPRIRPRATVGTRTLAVLPLQDQGAAADAYLAAGLTDDLIDILSAVPELRVRPRGAVAAFTAADRDAREVGRSLGVDAVVDGSLRRAGDLLRTTLRLVTVADGFQLWAKRFDRPPNELLSVADEAAADLTAVLASEKVPPPPSRESTTDPAAMDLYLRGRFIYTRSYFDVAEAVALLRAAHERAPDDGRITSAYALAMMRQHHVDVLPQSVADQAFELASAVIARDPTIAEARVAIALVHLANAEPRSAVIELMRALEIAPRNIDALAWMGNMLMELDRVELGIEFLNGALAEDPDLGMLDATLARAYALLGDWEASDAAFAKVRGDNLFRWIIAARLAVWRNDPVHAARLIAELDQVDLPLAGKTRALGILLVARDRALAPQARDVVISELKNVRIARKAAFNAQIRMELFCGAGLLDEARAGYQILEESSFADLTWLDRCPAIAPLRGTPEHEALRKTTAARVQRVTEVLDSTTSGLRRRVK